MRFLVSAVAVLMLTLTVAGTNAQAATIDLLDYSFQNATPGDTTFPVGPAPTPFTVVSHKFAEFNNAFVDTFKFKVTVANIPALVFDVTTMNHVLNMKFEIFNDLGQKLFSLSGFQGNDGDVHQTQFVFTDFLLDAMLASSFLTMKISGAFCSCASYSVAVSATPVPPAIMLFLTALGGMGVVGWRNRRAGRTAAAS